MSEETYDIKTPLTAPMPYFGGKRRVAEEVWRRFGNTPVYVEPFFGSGAILLARPHAPKIETVNDIDCYVVNLWRAVAADPAGVAFHACNPVFEADLHARHLWLVNEGKRHIEKCITDPEYYDVKVAGWWVWGMGCWIGGGFCSGKGPHRKPVEDGGDEDDQGVGKNLPYLSSIGQGVNQGMGDAGVSHVMPRLTGGQGVNRKLPNRGRGVNRGKPEAMDDAGIVHQMPFLSGPGQGVNKKGKQAESLIEMPDRGISRVMPFLGGFGKGVNKKSMAPGVVEALEGSVEMRLAWTYELMRDLCDRMRNVRITCGGWDRILGPAVTTGNGRTAVLLDPPYGADADCDQNVYTNNDSDVSKDVRAWAIENGDNPMFRIALCGYAGEHKLPEGWVEFAWKSAGGYGSQGKKTTRGKDNAHRERIWFSPHCINRARPTQMSMMAAIMGEDA